MGNIFVYQLNTVRWRLTKVVFTGIFFTIVTVLLCYYRTEHLHQCVNAFQSFHHIGMLQPIFNPREETILKETILSLAIISLISYIEMLDCFSCQTGITKRRGKRQPRESCISLQ